MIRWETSLFHEMQEEGRGRQDKKPDNNEGVYPLWH